MKELTKRERMARAFRSEEADRFPVSPRIRAWLAGEAKSGRKLRADPAFAGHSEPRGVVRRTGCGLRAPFFCLAALAFSAAAEAADWPQWRGVRRDGVSDETGWSTGWPEGGPKVLWRASVGAGYSCVSLAGGRVYTMGHAEKKDTVCCLDAGSGAAVWKHSYPCSRGSYPGPRSTPTVDGTRVYTVSRNGELLCLDAESGRAVWSKRFREDFGARRIDYGFSCSPLVHGDWLIVDAGPIVALEKATGELVWKSGGYKAAYASPVAFKVGGGSYIAAFNDFGLVVLSASDGGEMARRGWPTPYGMNCSTPVVSGGRIFISSTRSPRGYGRGGALMRFSPERGLDVVYESAEMANHCTTSVLWRGDLYGFSGRVEGGGTLVCMDFETGKVRWTKSGLGTGNVQVVDGRLVMLDERGSLFVAEASPSGYRELARAKVLSGQCWTAPVLSGGRVYCRNRRGDLVCLDVRGR